MTTEAPLLEERNTDQIVADVEKALAVHGWQGQAGGAGWALVRLFGRLAELVINRLNQVPDKHFLAFLNEARVDLLPPRPASVELTFTPAEDGLPFIRVPTGTQVATVQTETQPEVIFETQRDILVAPNKLVKCVAFDPLNYSDHTAQATGQASSSPSAPLTTLRASFAAFRGEQERQRILHLGDEALFTFADATSRQAAEIALRFEFDPPGDPARDGWKLTWLYWDGEKWAELRTGKEDDPEAQVVDDTENFAQDDIVTLKHLPELTETEVDGQTGLWIACKLTGGSGRDHLPVLSSVRGSRSINITSSQTATDVVGLSAIQANTAFVSLDLDGECFPLGQRPGRLDTFYLMSNEAFSKQGAEVTIQMAELIGVSEDLNSADLAADDLRAKREADLNNLTVVWEYHSTQGWTELGTSTRNGVDSKRLNFKDETLAFTSTSGEGETLSITFDVPPSEGDGPLFEETVVNDEQGLWIRARVVGGSYNVPAVVEILDKVEGSYKLHEATTYAPLVKQLEITYSSYGSRIEEKSIVLCRSHVDGMGRDHSPTFPVADAGPDQTVTTPGDEATVPLDASRSQASDDQSITQYTWRLVSSELEQTFAPFCAPEEGPALYLGFQQAFPAGKWIQLLLDVDEEKEPWQTNPTVFWEYWEGGLWTALRVSDGSQGLSERGYLGFFGPDDHQPSTEFGQNAYWLRARPPRAHPPPLAQARDDRAFWVEGQKARIILDASDSRAFGCQTISRYRWRLAPLANAGDDQQILAEDGEATVTLDASGSQAFDRQRSVTQYIWRLVSSSPPTADAGPDRTVSTPGDEAIVTLDASGSGTAGGRSIVKYIWRRTEPEAQEEEEEEGRKSVATPYLRAVRVNTVPAVNAVTIREEALGSSDGKPDQRFTLLRPPVLPGAQIAVREPDRPPDDELEQLQKELQQADEAAQALLPTPEAAPGEGVWVRWHQVSDFHASSPASRHFTLDPISGQVCFGDGKRGKIPPVGRDNIKAVLYRTHDGSKGNAAAGTITVPRNPSGDLANIESVTNPEAAAGGSDAETMGEVKQRGPQTLKHRQRAVTLEDFAWLAREATGEVVQARCLPTRNPDGLPEAGWVTVVITPESVDRKPTPSPALLRQVQNYLESRALANLRRATQNHGIHVKGPEYVEVTVLAEVIPSEPEKSDEVEIAVLERLQAFLHPLRGGPERTGWELGRDVYLSEVYAEIEAVPGVDHVARVRLLGSLQQHRLRLRKENGYREVPYDLPVGSQVSTFDERIKLLLAEPVFKKKDSDEALTSLTVYGFKVGDEVAIVETDNTVVKKNLTVASLSGDAVTFDFPFDAPAGWDQRDALMSPDGRLRLPLSEDGIRTNSEGKVTGVTVQSFKAGDKVSVVVGARRDPALEFLPIEVIKPCEDRIFVPEGHLIYSGDHDIEMVLE